MIRGMSDTIRGVTDTALCQVRFRWISNAIRVMWDTIRGVSETIHRVLETISGMSDNVGTDECRIGYV